MRNEDNILEIENLTLDAFIKDGYYNILNEINIKIPRGRSVAIVGESGSGKTITALSVIKLLEKKFKGPTGVILDDLMAGIYTKILLLILISGF